jgi:hypothetical protein
MVALLAAALNDVTRLSQMNKARHIQRWESWCSLAFKIRGDSVVYIYENIIDFKYICLMYKPVFILTD